LISVNNCTYKYKLYYRVKSVRIEHYQPSNTTLLRLGIKGIEIGGAEAFSIHIMLIAKRSLAINCISVGPPEAFENINVELWQSRVAIPFGPQSLLVRSPESGLRRSPSTAVKAPRNMKTLVMRREGLRTCEVGVKTSRRPQGEGA